MTISYGATAFGMSQQCIDDSRKHGIPLLMNNEHIWSSYMGRLIYNDCKKSIKRPMQLLSVFEEAGRLAEGRDEFLKWYAPVTNFPVVQHYMEGTVKKVWLQYGPPRGERLSTDRYENTYQVNLCFTEELKPAKKKQSQGAAPNAIHSLDAAHLMLTIHNCNFTVTTVHDAYGCLLGDMQDLYVIVRESFVELYEKDPLKSLVTQLGGDMSAVDIGTLDLSLILESEYAFA
jgi:DNA-directed RNA polymerase